MARSITLAQADAVIVGCIEEATAIMRSMSIAVVDDGGHLVAFASMDRTTLIGADISRRKAGTAVHFQRDTRDLAPEVLPGLPLFGIEATTGHRFVFFGGGVLLRTPDGQVAGGIGVSAGSVEEDHRVAEAGRAAFTSMTGSTG